MNNKLTLKSVRATLAPLGVTVRKTSDGEYLTRLKGSPAGEGSYCLDLADSLATGQSMAKWQMGTMI